MWAGTKIFIKKATLRKEIFPSEQTAEKSGIPHYPSFLWIFSIVIVTVGQESSHFLRTLATCGNSSRIFCGHRWHVATASAFFADIGDTWQQLPHFLRTSVTRGNSFRIFCGNRRHVATASAFFADIVDTWQQLPHFLRTSSTCGNSSRIFCGNRPRMSTITCKMENFYFTQPIGWFHQGYPWERELTTRYR